MAASDNNSNKLGKEKLRAQAKALLAQLTPKQRREAAEALKRDLVDYVREGMAVLAYATLAGEVPVEAALEELLARGVPIFLPKIEQDSMEFLQWQGQNLPVNGWGLRQPKGDEAKWRARDYASSIVLLPGLLFDQRGYRLGRGKGYYDRFLRRQGGEAMTRIGILFHKQLVAALPAEPWDQRVDLLWRY